jgi:hypothetical protein
MPSNARSFAVRQPCYSPVDNLPSEAGAERSSAVVVYQSSAKRTASLCASHESHRLVIARARAPREGWEEAFRAAGSSAHDELFLDAPANQFDREEWRWLLASASNELGT